MKKLLLISLIAVFPFNFIFALTDANYSESESFVNAEEQAPMVEDQAPMTEEQAPATEESTTAEESVAQPTEESVPYNPGTSKEALFSNIMPIRVITEDEAEQEAKAHKAAVAKKAAQQQQATKPAVQPAKTVVQPVKPAASTPAPVAPQPAVLSAVAKKDRPLLYEPSFDLIAKEYIALLNTKTTDDYTQLDATQKNYCDRRYNTILNDRKIDIRISFGYFDWSTGSDIGSQNLNFGKSPSVDLGAYKSMQNTLTAPCQTEMSVCGFTASTQEVGLYTKTLVIRGETYTAEVRMSQPSVSEFYNENLAQKEQQQAKSDATRDFYVKSLQEADYAIYIGHSRNGGGPDFYPPILKEDGHADYNGYYLPKKIGLKTILEAFKSSSRQAPMMALFSCDSKDHFLSQLQAVAPRTGFVTSTRVDTINNLFAASLGSMDALLRGQCQKSFYQSLRLDPRAQDLMTMDNMFN